MRRTQNTMQFKNNDFSIASSALCGSAGEGGYFAPTALSNINFLTY